MMHHLARKWFLGLPLAKLLPSPSCLNQPESLRFVRFCSVPPVLQAQGGGRGKVVALSFAQMDRPPCS